MPVCKMVFDAKEEFEAIFGDESIKTYASLEEAKRQNPSYVVASFKSQQHNDNWRRNWEIHNIQSPGKGFVKGLWRSETKFSTFSSWFPNPPRYNLIDPKGEIKQFECQSFSATAEVLRKLNQIYVFESWKQFELASENTRLQDVIKRLETANSKLKAELTELKK